MTADMPEQDDFDDNVPVISAPEAKGERMNSGNRNIDFSSSKLLFLVLSSCLSILCYIGNDKITKIAALEAEVRQLDRDLLRTAAQTIANSTRIAYYDGLADERGKRLISAEKEIEFHARDLQSHDIRIERLERHDDAIRQRTK